MQKRIVGRAQQEATLPDRDWGGSFHFPTEDPIRAAQLDEVRVHLITTELDLAFTFLRAAKIAQNREDRERYMENARKARDEAELLAKQGLVCTELQQDSIKTNMARLETQLNAQTRV